MRAILCLLSLPSELFDRVSEARGNTAEEGLECKNKNTVGLLSGILHLP